MVFFILSKILRPFSLLTLFDILQFLQLRINREIIPFYRKLRILNWTSKNLIPFSNNAANFIIKINKHI